MRDLANVNFDELNTTELRALCLERAGKQKHISPWTPRKALLEYLLENKPLPENPLQKVRMHQMCSLIDRYSFYGPMLQCDANCFEHEDLQVVECQVQNPQLRHESYPTEEN